jgi:hypothetical protein
MQKKKQQLEKEMARFTDVLGWLKGLVVGVLTGTAALRYSNTPGIRDLQ